VPIVPREQDRLAGPCHELPAILHTDVKLAFEHVVIGNYLRIIAEMAFAASGKNLHRQAPRFPKFRTQEKAPAQPHDAQSV
jgi:hypothetical protein